MTTENDSTVEVGLTAEVLGGFLVVKKQGEGDANYSESLGVTEAFSGCYNREHSCGLLERHFDLCLRSWKEY